MQLFIWKTFRALDDICFVISLQIPNFELIFKCALEVLGAFFVQSGADHETLI